MMLFLILELMDLKQYWNNTIAENDDISHYWKIMTCIQKISSTNIFFYIAL